ncbi:MAG: MotA/TolQ/ExbB proton channel family protein [Bacteroidales bacterium]|jgi:biopolymer transport protein ExbB|nr:MotA/TolQ/ExbB proton channel family protein [Bacteroidales bacterium]MDD2633672.1 MotA/TolQ/ExbB proton channel family protein [Bacteroidales bacterium]MDD3130997.1 MotA/TolQ/ExbB proton channel family protein [Bacteroidales bacterium]MDD3527873.1 MotA/TolQ/ExbB proton channel family protein [Bacteroidales bacterium]MDD4177479.1 MotA/TolQ/ExbB proton channel family protein [Bacteroidales bacterium]
MVASILLQMGQAGQMLGDTTMAAQSGEISMSLWDLALKGGWIIAILALFSIIAIYIFIERFLTINNASREDTNFMNHIRDFIHDGKIDAALAMCRKTANPIARMIEKGLLRIGKPLNDINAAIENVGKLEVSRLEKNIAALATIAGAAPMLGFLGTVIGMIRAFYDMSMAGNNIDIALLSSGIYQAMVTTVAGLIVGILAFICYNILVARVEKLVFKLEARATEFMDVLNEPVA